MMRDRDKGAGGSLRTVLWGVVVVSSGSLEKGVLLSLLINAFQSLEEPPVRAVVWQSIRPPIEHIPHLQ
jgi:hypothetical protein